MLKTTQGLLCKPYPNTWFKALLHIPDLIALSTDFKAQKVISLKTYVHLSYKLWSTVQIYTASCRMWNGKLSTAEYFVFLCMHLDGCMLEIRCICYPLGYLTSTDPGEETTREQMVKCASSKDNIGTSKLGQVEMMLEDLHGIMLQQSTHSEEHKRKNRTSRSISMLCSHDISPWESAAAASSACHCVHY